MFVNVLCMRIGILQDSISHASGQVLSFTKFSKYWFLVMARSHLCSFLNPEIQLYMIVSY